MLDKIKSIKNNLRIGDKLEELRIKEMSAQIAGFFKKIYGFIYRFFDLAGKNFSRSGISANLVSVSGFVIGIFAINFLAMECMATHCSVFSSTGLLTLLTVQLPAIRK